MKPKTKEAVELLQALIATPSTSRDEARTGDLLFAFLADHGAAPERLYNNVWARAEGFDPRRPTLLLNSHHDTVRPAASYTRDPYAPTLEEGRLYGLGSNDAGASVVSLAETFLTFRTRRLPFNLVVALSAEEECMGEHGMRALLPALGPIDMALVGEPTGMQAATGERGLVVLDCTAHGRSGHAARGEGVNALYIAMDDIARLRTFRFERESQLLGPVGIAVTQIGAGTQHNVVPDTCRFVVDVRTTDAYSNEEVVEQLRAALHSDVVPRSTRIRAAAVGDDHPLVRAARAVGRQTFVSPTTSDRTLMPFPSLKMGPGESARSHSADEFVLVAEIDEAITIYEQYIEQLAKLYA
ncbi:acetylornithine deacetylase [Alistipes sp. An116]|uniref:M20 family metallo-hydrolase n=1 Tax=Alistipes sp. An116 TaxID=1965546 RepID=UPI000B390235|nr:M20 family metallo-hydrolase [Alistipes sp. An116]OUQ54156.1 acetylornithine deacetylase [Alistipes sp. An116]